MIECAGRFFVVLKNAEKRTTYLARRLSLDEAEPAAQYRERALRALLQLNDDLVAEHLPAGLGARHRRDARDAGDLLGDLRVARRHDLISGDGR